MDEDSDSVSAGEALGNAWKGCAEYPVCLSFFSYGTGIKSGRIYFDDHPGGPSVWNVRGPLAIY